MIADEPLPLQQRKTTRALGICVVENWWTVQQIAWQGKKHILQINISGVVGGKICPAVAIVNENIVISYILLYYSIKVGSVFWPNRYTEYDL